MQLPSPLDVTLLAFHFFIFMSNIMCQGTFLCDKLSKVVKAKCFAELTHGDVRFPIFCDILSQSINYLKKREKKHPIYVTAAKTRPEFQAW